MALGSGDTCPTSLSLYLGRLGWAYTLDIFPPQYIGLTELLEHRMRIFVSEVSQQLN